MGLPAAGAAPRRVLVIEDAAEFAVVVRHVMAEEGYTVEVAATGRGGVELGRSFRPDVVILDLLLPDMGGLEVCRELRSFTDAYVLMLTSKGDEVDKVVGLAVGADDYMTKPFSTRELAARVAAMLRRPRAPAATAATASILSHDGLRVDTEAYEVTLHGVALQLTPLEFQLLSTLMGRPNRVFTRAMLRAVVWGEDWYGDEHVVDVHIANLRKKIDVRRDTSYLKTVRGVGYKFAPGNS